VTDAKQKAANIEQQATNKVEQKVRDIEQKVAGAEQKVTDAKQKAANIEQQVANKVEQKVRDIEQKVADAEQKVTDAKQKAANIEQQVANKVEQKVGDIEGKASGAMQGLSDLKNNTQTRAQEQATEALGQHQQAAQEQVEHARNAINQAQGKVDSFPGQQGAKIDSLSASAAASSFADSSKLGDSLPDLDMPNTKPDELPTALQTPGGLLADQEPAEASEEHDARPRRWFPAPAEIKLAPNVINTLVLDFAPGRFTLRQLVDKLLEIEAAEGYETARFVAKQLDYQAVCDIRDLNDEENDPNIMPSRFMLLPDADDDSLAENNCLDDIPWPVHSDGPQKLSITFFKQCLTLSGYYPSTTPNAQLPSWYSPDLPGQQNTDTENPAPEPAVRQPAPPVNQVFDEELLQAFQRYLQNDNSHADEQISAGNYTVQEGDTLSAIALAQGYPHWQVIYDANRDVIENPDFIAPGQALVLPAMSIGDIDDWFIANEAPEGMRSANNYQFPAVYCSLTLLDRQQQLLEHEDGWVFEGYTKEPDHLFYQLKITRADELRVLMPRGNNVVLGFTDESFVADNLFVKPFAALQSIASGSDQQSTVTDNEDEFVYDELPLLDQKT